MPFRLEALLPRVPAQRVEPESVDEDDGVRLRGHWGLQVRGWAAPPVRARLSKLREPTQGAVSLREDATSASDDREPSQAADAEAAPDQSADARGGATRSRAAARARRSGAGRVVRARLPGRDPLQPAQRGGVGVWADLGRGDAD